jgi:hypothetical protein
MDRPGGPGPQGCAILRAHEPRDAHEYALVAQLKEFYSDDPSNERIMSIARKVAESTDDERSAMRRKVVSDLCPGAPEEAFWPFWRFGLLVMVALAVIAICVLLRKKSTTR